MSKRGNGKRMPAENVKLWPISKIIPYERNPRTHPEEQIALLARMMERFGVDQPIVVDEDGIIIKGHGRRLAAIKAGFSRFPVVVKRGMSEEDKKAERIADNQAALLAGWDEQLMKLELGDLALAGFNDLPILGFSEDALAAFTGAIGEGLAPGGAGVLPTQSLSDRFGIVPFSVFNAREGLWQARKRAWLALGIQSEVGRGANLIGRSPQELFCHYTGIPYDKARKIVTDAMEAEGDAFDLHALVRKHGGGKSDFSKSGAVMPVKEGDVKAALIKKRGYEPRKKKTRHGQDRPQSKDLRDGGVLRTTTDPYRRGEEVA